MRFLIVFLIFFTSQNLLAYSSTKMNGDIIKPGSFNFSTDLQYITENDSGFNLNARVDLPLNADMNIRGVLGFGEVDFHAGGYLKWIPFPDYGNQPAVGGLVGAHYAKIGNLNEFSIRAHPYASKSFHLSIGKISPYAALPIAMTFVDGESNIPIQFQLGTEVKIRELRNVSFLAEFGVDIADSFSFFSLGVAFNYDQNYGFKFQ